MGKKSKLSLFRFFQPFSLKHKLLTVLYQGIMLVASYCYSLSLEGGDLESLKEKIPLFVGLLLLNLLLTGLVAVGIWYSFHTKLRILNWALQFVILLFTVTRDLGTDLEHHGQFNLLLYV